MNDTILMLILLGVLVIAILYLIWEINFCLNTVIYTRQKKKMFKSLENILLSYYNKNDTTACFKEINLIFKHIIDRNEELKRNYASVDFLLEKYLIELNAQNKKVVNVNIQDINNLKAYILQLIDEFKKKNPMEQVKGANFVLFNDIIQYFHHNESDKFDEAINQLAIEMKNLQDTLFEKEKNSKRQDVLTIVGLVLSVLFGIMTFIQFFI
ncbi:hypothetical protein [uncultured Eubacterium sp.]|uniref:hypothetical protein n=1 Tax=uncultured Eubacterium sp. TaxID=165185 RepID=UPI003266CC76